MDIEKENLDLKFTLKEIYGLQEFDISVRLLGLSDKVVKALINVGIDNYKELINVSISELIDINVFNTASFKKIIETIVGINEKIVGNNYNELDNGKKYLSKFDLLIGINIKDDKVKEIIELRNQGLTLEEIGQRKKVTRERIRQIEDKAIKKIVDAINDDDVLIDYLSDISDEGFLKASRIIEIMQSENACIFSYVLKNKKIKNICYFDEYDGYLINKDEAYVQKILEMLPKIVKKDGVNVVVDIIASENNLSHTLVYEIITKSYKDYKNYYGKGTLDTFDMSAYITDAVFPNGIKITDQEQLQHLADLMNEYFGKDYKDSLRPLQARVTDTFALIGRGTYVSNSDEKYFIDVKTINRIDKYISKYKRNVLPYENLYETFKDDLIKFNISNKYILQSMMKKYIVNKYTFTRDYVYKNERYDFADEVVGFIKNAGGIVSTSTIRKEFSDVKPYTVTRCLLSENLISTTNGYIHKCNIHITKNEWDSIIKEIEVILSDDETYHVDDIYKLISKDVKNILIRENFDLPDRLYFLLKGFYGDRFTYSRPYMAKVGVDIKKGDDKLLKEIIERKEIYIGELPGLKEKYNVTLNSILGFVESNIDSIIFEDNNRIVALDSINIDENSFRQIDDVLDDFIGDKNVDSLYRFNMYDELPQIDGKEWNPWLLYSIIKLYSNIYDSATTSNHFRDAVPLIIKKDYNISEDEKLQFANDKQINKYVVEDYEDLEDLFDY